MNLRRAKIADEDREKRLSRMQHGARATAAQDNRAHAPSTTCQVGQRFPRHQSALYELPRIGARVRSTGTRHEQPP